MADTYSVSYITNTMRGAPVISGNTPGCLIAVLDALLINGWGLAAPTSVSVAGGVATATFSGPTSWEIGAVIGITGGTPSGLAGKSRVVSVVGNTLTFATTAADGTYTGSIGIKYAPAGWEKVFTATNKAVYRSTDVTGARLYLRVDDSSNLFARVRGFESMSDVDTGFGMFPLDTMISGGGYWYKSVTSSAAAAPYLMAADARLLLQAVMHGIPGGSTRSGTKVQGFGDIIAGNPGGDAWATVLSVSSSESNGYLNYGGLSGATADSNGGFGMASFARGWQGLGSSVHARPFPETGRDDQLSGNCTMFGAAPSVVDGQIKLSRMLLRDQAGVIYRGVVPGVYYIPQTAVLSLFATPGALVERADGRRLAVLHVGTATDYFSGVALVDVTGPWR